MKGYKNIKFLLKDVDDQECDMTRVVNFFNEKNMPIEWKVLYNEIGNSYELVYGDVHFLSFDNLMDESKSMEKYDVIDVAYVYEELGWFISITYSINDRKFFFRLNGGSSGIDYSDNILQLKKFINNVDNSKLYDVDQLLDILKNQSENISKYLHSNNMLI